MFALQVAGNISPDLLEPSTVVAFVNEGEVPLLLRWMPVRAGLAEEQNEFDVVFDDRVRLVWFAEKPAVARHLRGHIGNLAPDDRSQRVQAQFLTLRLDICVQRL